MSMLQTIESRILEIRGVPAILDSDVAVFYGVETKHVNQAVRNNPDKFPPGYILPLTSGEWDNLKSKISTSSWGGTSQCLYGKGLVYAGDDPEKSAGDAVELP